jgi:hypothetical protein
MKHRPDQGAEPPEPSSSTDKGHGVDQERLKVWEKSWPSKLEPGTPEWWQEREDQPGDILPDPNKR